MFKSGNLYLIVFLFLLIFTPLIIHTYVTSIRSSCNFDTLEEVTSPNRLHRLVIYRETCSKFNSTSIKGSILTLDEIIELHYDNIFKIDPMYLKTYSDESIEAVWENPTSLTIYSDASIKFKNNKKTYKDISIEYLEK